MREPLQFTPDPAASAAAKASSECFLLLQQEDDSVCQSGQANALLGVKRAAGPHAMSDGLFAEWNWDGRVLTVRNDRYGIYPLYYFRHGKRFALSPSIPKLIALGAPTDWDDDAIAVLLRFESCLEEDTPFRAIRALPPGAMLRWEAGRLTLQSLRPASPKPFTGSREEAIDRFNLLFAEAIRSRAPPGSDFAVPLSAGRDSRHILLQLLADGWAPGHCISTRYHPPRPNNDALLASGLAARLGLQHLVLEQPRSLRSVLLRHYRLTNFCSTMPSFFLWVASDYLYPRTGTLYDGLAGDVLSAGACLTQQRLEGFEGGRFTDLAERHLKPDMERTLKSTLAPELYRRWSRERAVARFARALPRHADAPNPAGSFALFNRIRRNTALQPYRIFGRIRTVHCPYLDHALYDHLASLPARMLLDHTLHTDAIHRAFPQYADYPFNAYEEAARHVQSHYRRFTREVLGSVLSHPSRVLRQSSILSRLGRCVVDRHYRSSIDWIGQRVLYLMELERVSESN